MSCHQVSKNIVLQWGEMPTSVAYIGTGQIMGWGNKAIEIRSVETGHLDGVFMHKKAQRLKFLCERNDKVENIIFLWIDPMKSSIMQHLLYVVKSSSNEEEKLDFLEVDNEKFREIKILISCPLFQEYTPCLFWHKILRLHLTYYDTQSCSFLIKD